MSEEVIVTTIPDCDICGLVNKKVPAEFDAATTQGPWAYVCQMHFEQYCFGLGTGRGQRLVLRQP